MLNGFKYIGAAVGQCAGIAGCENAPELIKTTLNLENQWQKTVLYPYHEPESKVEDLAVFSDQLANITADTLKAGHHFVTLGGDHSSAIGTWSGVSSIYPEFGLIWIDAHMDAHTPETSPSGNLHGMPVACLLGYGEQALRYTMHEHAKLKPENLVQIGIRSFESGEAALLKQHGVKIHYSPEVEKVGFEHLFQKAVNRFKAKGIPYGISFDLDGLDPKYIQALGTPVDRGIDLNQLLNAFSTINLNDFIGLEITEYNPTLDASGYPGLQVIQQILEVFPQ